VRPAQEQKRKFSMFEAGVKPVIKRTRKTYWVWVKTEIEI
jgi:hypothetical protein